MLSYSETRTLTLLWPSLKLLDSLLQEILRDLSREFSAWKNFILWTKFLVPPPLCKGQGWEVYESWSEMRRVRVSFLDFNLPVYQTNLIVKLQAKSLDEELTLFYPCHKKNNKNKNNPSPKYSRRGGARSLKFDT